MAKRLNTVWIQSNYLFSFLFTFQIIFLYLPHNILLKIKVFIRLEVLSNILPAFPMMMSFFFFLVFRYANVKTPERHVRTRLYFTSVS